MKGRFSGAVAGARLLAGGRTRTPGALIFAYHDVTTSGTTEYQVSPPLLRAHLRWATGWGVSFVSLATLVDAVLSHRDVDGLGAVVFDDAIAGVHRHALDILDEFGVPGTLFVVSNRTGQVPDWWAGSDRLMTKDEVLAAAARGVTIGAHTRTHPSLPEIDRASMEEEVRGSRRELEDMIGRPVDLLAYPFGHFDRAVRDVAADAGYRAAFTFLNGRVMPGMDPFRLPRLTMWGGQTRPRLAYHVARSSASWGPTQVGGFVSGVASEEAP